MNANEQYRTRHVKKSEITRDWYIVDAKDAVLGRISSRIAKIIQGKEKPHYTPSQNNGDKVIVINAEHVRMTGKKMTDKQYIRHTGYPGGQKVETPQDIMDKHPEELIRRSVDKMLPKNRLRQVFLKNLHIYSGEQHEHEAQKPKKLEL